MALKKKNQLDSINFDFAYLTLDATSLGNLQKALNTQANIKSLNLLLYKCNVPSNYIELLFDGLVGMPNLSNLDLNLGGSVVSKFKRSRYCL